MILFRIWQFQKHLLLSKCENEKSLHLWMDSFILFYLSSLGSKKGRKGNYIPRRILSFFFICHTLEVKKEGKKITSHDGFFIWKFNWTRIEYCSISDEDGDEGNSLFRLWSFFWKRIRLTIHSWKLYINSPIRNAGLALGCLYLTVMGFGNITYGYCLAQCVSESVLGAVVGVSAVIGCLGSISFPYLRKWFGIRKTGIIGFYFLTIILCFAVVSVFLPGSPFDPFYLTSFKNSIDLDKGGLKEAYGDCYVSRQIFFKRSETFFQIWSSYGLHSKVLHLHACLLSN